MRNNILRYFPPENLATFDLGPGEEGSFLVGWFFPASMGQWDPPEAESVFQKPGEYTIRVTYRNSFPVAMVNRENPPGADTFEVWTGELRSNPVTIRMVTSEE